MTIQCVRSYYSLPVKRGMTVRPNRKEAGWTGKVASERNGLLKVKIHNSVSWYFHPHELDYLTHSGWISSDKARSDFEERWSSDFGQLDNDLEPLFKLGKIVVPDWNLMGSPNFNVNKTPGSVNVYLMPEEDQRNTLAGEARNIGYYSTCIGHFFAENTVPEYGSGYFFADISLVSMDLAVTFLHELAHVKEFVDSFISCQQAPKDFFSKFIWWGLSFRGRIRDNREAHGESFMSAYSDIADKAEGYLPLKSREELWGDRDHCQYGIVD